MPIRLVESQVFRWSMIFSENRCTLFGIMLEPVDDGPFLFLYAGSSPTTSHAASRSVLFGTMAEGMR